MVGEVVVVGDEDVVEVVGDGDDVVVVDEETIVVVVLGWIELASGATVGCEVDTANTYFDKTP